MLLVPNVHVGRREQASGGNTENKKNTDWKKAEGKLSFHKYEV